MSVRSSLAYPSPQSGQVGEVIESAALFPVVANAATTVSQFLSPITLPAGTWSITTSVQILDTTAASGYQYIGLGLNGTAYKCNYYTDGLFSALSSDFVLSSTNVITLTAASTVISLWVQAGTAITTQTYGSWANTQPVITATKIA
jgi:hypothetical protein